MCIQVEIQSSFSHQHQPYKLLNQARGHIGVTPEEEPVYDEYEQNA